MNDINLIIGSIKAKVQRTVEQSGHLANENNNLKNQIGRLENEIKERKSEIDQLKRQIEIMKIAGSIGSDQSDKGSKQKIAELVREIDYCITLLK